MALPPAAAQVAAPRAPREVTYIIDTSGSMEGVSIAQARDALVMALDRLQPGDRFNVIEFNSTTRSLFAAPVPVDAATLHAREAVRGRPARARRHRDAAGARDRARRPARSVDAAPGRVPDRRRGRQRGPDPALVGERIGDRRLFTVGIGPAPNMFFMTKAAQFGRGTYTAIGDVREVQEKMTALFRKLESPALTDIAVDWPAGADVWPRVVPDLYAGEPVVVSARSTTRTRRRGNVALSGRRGGAMWGTLLPAVGERAAEPAWACCGRARRSTR